MWFELQHNMFEQNTTTGRYIGHIVALAFFD